MSDISRKPENQDGGVIGGAFGSFNQPAQSSNSSPAPPGTGFAPQGYTPQGYYPSGPTAPPPQQHTQPPQPPQYTQPVQPGYSPAGTPYQTSTPGAGYSNQPFYGGQQPPHQSAAPPPPSGTGQAGGVYQSGFQPSGSAPHSSPTASVRDKGKVSAIKFWVPFILITLFYALFFAGGGAKPLGWVVLGVVVVLSFLLRHWYSRRNFLIAVFCWFLCFALLMGTAAVFTTTAQFTVETSGGMSVKEMGVGLGLDKGQNLINPTSTFKPDTPEIFFSAMITNVKSNTAVDIRWTYLDQNQSINGPTQRINADARVGFSLTRPTNGWPVGNYQAMLILNGKESGVVKFVVK